jgi:hypothetical protein
MTLEQLLEPVSVGTSGRAAASGRRQNDTSVSIIGDQSGLAVIRGELSSAFSVSKFSP